MEKLELCDFVFFSEPASGFRKKHRREAKSFNKELFSRRHFLDNKGHPSLSNLQHEEIARQCNITHSEVRNKIARGDYDIDTYIKDSLNLDREPRHEKRSCCPGARQEVLERMRTPSPHRRNQEHNEIDASDFPHKAHRPSPKKVDAFITRSSRCDEDKIEAESGCSTSSDTSSNDESMERNTMKGTTTKRRDCLSSAVLATKGYRYSKKSSAAQGRRRTVSSEKKLPVGRDLSPTEKNDPNSIKAREPHHDPPPIPDSPSISNPYRLFKETRKNGNSHDEESKTTCQSLHDSKSLGSITVIADPLHLHFNCACSRVIRVLRDPHQHLISVTISDGNNGIQPKEPDRIFTISLPSFVTYETHPVDKIETRSQTLNSPEGKEIHHDYSPPIINVSLPFITYQILEYLQIASHLEANLTRPSSESMRTEDVVLSNLELYRSPRYTDGREDYRDRNLGRSSPIPRIIVTQPDQLSPSETSHVTAASFRKATEASPPEDYEKGAVDGNFQHSTASEKKEEPRNIMPKISKVATAFGKTDQCHHVDIWQNCKPIHLEGSFSKGKQELQEDQLQPKDPNTVEDSARGLNVRTANDEPLPPPPICASPVPIQIIPVHMHATKADQHSMDEVAKRKRDIISRFRRQEVTSILPEGPLQNHNRENPINDEYCINYKKSIGMARSRSSTSGYSAGSLSHASTSRSSFTRSSSVERE
ncbi:hypothetical protein HDU67_008317 [Dinochytrium kinnereticum]|nr:hypothetical protein HDU67_008317 [Dinochytrium kinnereticum]